MPQDKLVFFSIYLISTEVTKSAHVSKDGIKAPENSLDHSQLFKFVLVARTGLIALDMWQLKNILDIPLRQ